MQVILSGHLRDSEEPGAETTMYLAQVPTEIIKIAPQCPSTAFESAIPAGPASVWKQLLACTWIF